MRPLREVCNEPLRCALCRTELDDAPDAQERHYGECRSAGGLVLAALLIAAARLAAAREVRAP